MKQADSAAQRQLFLALEDVGIGFRSLMEGIRMMVRNHISEFKIFLKIVVLPLYYRL